MRNFYSRKWLNNIFFSLKCIWFQIKIDLESIFLSSGEKKRWIQDTTKQQKEPTLCLLFIQVQQRISGYDMNEYCFVFHGFAWNVNKCHRKWIEKLHFIYFSFPFPIIFNWFFSFVFCLSSFVLDKLLSLLCLGRVLRFVYSVNNDQHNDSRSEELIIILIVVVLASFIIIHIFSRNLF